MSSQVHLFLTSIGAGTAGWDTRGNLASDPVSGMTYGYSSEDLLTSGSGGVTLGYDPLQRLGQISQVRVAADWPGGRDTMSRSVPIAGRPSSCRSFAPDRRQERRAAT